MGEQEQRNPCFLFSRGVLACISPTLVVNSGQESYAGQGDEEGKENKEKLVAEFLGWSKFKAKREGQGGLNSLHCPAQLTRVRVKMDLRQKGL